MHRLTIFLFAALALFTTGCFQIEESIDLKKDMSGTAGVKIGVDMEPMIVFMAQAQHDMQGKKGPVTAEELAAAKADFKKQGTTKTSETKDPRAELEHSLPAGITLLDAAVTERDFVVESSFKFGFDRLAHLIDLRLPSKNDDPAKKNVIDTPFTGMEITETPTTFTIRTKPQNPAEKVSEQAKGQASQMNADMERMMREAFKGLHVTYRIAAPFEVVSSNATRKEGNVLIWEYGVDQLEKMSKSTNPDDLGVKVTYRK